MISYSVLYRMQLNVQYPTLLGFLRMYDSVVIHTSDKASADLLINWNTNWITNLVSWKEKKTYSHRKLRWAFC